MEKDSPSPVRYAHLRRSEREETIAKTAFRLSAVKRCYTSGYYVLRIAYYVLRIAYYVLRIA